VDELLKACGVTPETLAPEEGALLDERGYVVLRGVLKGSLLARLQAAFEAAVEPGAESGTRHGSDLLARDALFDVTFTHPRVLAAAHRVLGRPFQVLALGARDPLPGFGLQGLHTDWPPRAAGEGHAVATALWLLDDFTAENGATRVVPGSQRVPGAIPRSHAAPGAHHPRETLVTAEAGSVLCLNGHLWHSGTCNRSRAPRRVVQCQFVARGLVPPGSARSVPPARLAAPALRLLGLAAPAP
jgi:ectoine hydroxylase-related dioxygenase (phytanoyl-CoA dioxygenase family)